MLIHYNLSTEIFLTHSLLMLNSLQVPAGQADENRSDAARVGIKKIKRLLRAKCAEYGIRSAFGYVIPDDAITKIRDLCRETYPDWEIYIALSILKVCKSA